MEKEKKKKKGLHTLVCWPCQSRQTLKLLTLIAEALAIDKGMGWAAGENCNKGLWQKAFQHFLRLIDRKLIFDAQSTRNSSDSRLC